ncbi:hypothetical protein [Paenibacillus sp. 23TSA30-6]|uniref:hypothetical protein n=1 Tax=Paenibacillus sp. 23TSA30-6 TaxID=2546104 RepID=UPI001787D7E7|nr:hypothetical protein [Paenibacillus sp. 23TSA30-6]MBE0339495.1 hypothetical protein [Paenibacillus sp. 23TSA30-6]
MERMEQLLSYLNIEKILVIDDELYLNYEERLEPAKLIIEQYKEEQSFKDLFLEILEPEEIEKIIEYGEYETLYEEEEKRNKVLDIVTRHSASMFKGSAYHMLEKIEKYFPDLIVHGLSDPRSQGEHKIADFDLIFMDYEYEHEYTALRALETLNLNSTRINYVIFVSARDTFVHTDGKSYSMEDSEIKQKLFRNIRSDNSSRFTALLSYINKKNTVEDSSYFPEIYHNLLEFESGKIMVDSINSLTGLLNDGIEQVRKNLMLTNTKTMKALITDKLEVEGVSETSYLVDFSLSMVKNLVNENIERLKSIHDSLSKIHSWPGEIWDYETDQHIRDLRKIQLFDEFVNKRFEPIMFGDTFEIEYEGELTKAVLVSQVCDMVVRVLKKDTDPSRNEKMVTLILQTKTPGNGANIYKNRIGNEEIYWDIRKKMLVPSELLDFCSTNDEGKATILFNKNLTRKFSWSNHYHLYINKLNESKSALFSKLSDGMQYISYDGMSYRMTKEPDKANFFIKRIARLDSGITSHILNMNVTSQTRVPLFLDPSNDILDLKEMEVNYSGKKTDEIKIYYYKKNAYIDLNSLVHCIEQTGKENFKAFNDALNETIKKNIPSKYFLLNDYFEDKKLLAITPEVNERLLKLGLRIITKPQKMLATIDLEELDEVAVGREITQ